MPAVIRHRVAAANRRRALSAAGWFGALLAAVLIVPREAPAQPIGNQQQPGFQNQFQNQNALIAPGGGPQGNVLFGPNAGLGASANADFESLIDLIESTVQPGMWASTGGGDGDIRPFFGGVLVDAAGTLRLKSGLSRAGSGGDGSADLGKLRELRAAAPPRAAPVPGAARQASALRYVSLPRLEREIARRQAAGEPLDASMLTLAGLRRVRYVFVYPESGDLVLAGPAGDWTVDADGRIRAADNGDAVVRLDDLLTLLRRGQHSAESYFGCSINPRPESLANTQAYLDSTGAKPLEPGQRRQWLADLRDTLGQQDIEIFGVDPSSRAAGVLVEADYHMKLIGMGLAEGVDGVESYLASVKLIGGQPPAMSVLRWWFALDYDAVRATEERDAFELVGQGARVMSENELLAERGERIPTGQSDALNRQFAESFSTHFAALAEKYPVYAELRNIFDLAMVAALVDGERLTERTGWQPSLLVDAERLPLPRWATPRQVETVVNHRVLNRRHIIAGVSGGVMAAPGDVLKRGAAYAVDETGETAERRLPIPADVEPAAWWWDATE